MSLIKTTRIGERGATVEVRAQTLNVLNITNFYDVSNPYTASMSPNSTTFGQITSAFCAAQSAIARNNLGALYEQTGRRDDAIAATERAVQVLEENMGYEHPWLAEPLSQLALLCARAGQHERAEVTIKRSLRIAEAKLGGQHPTVATVLMIDAAVLREAKRKREASQAEARARAIRSVLGQSSFDSVVDVQALTETRSRKGR